MSRHDERRRVAPAETDSFSRSQRSSTLIGRSSPVTNAHFSTHRSTAEVKHLSIATFITCSCNQVAFASQCYKSSLTINSLLTQAEWIETKHHLQEFVSEVSTLSCLTVGQENQAEMYRKQRIWFYFPIYFSLFINQLVCNLSLFRIK